LGGQAKKEFSFLFQNKESDYEYLEQKS